MTPQPFLVIHLKFLVAVRARAVQISINELNMSYRKNSGS